MKTLREIKDDNPRVCYALMRYLSFSDKILDYRLVNGKELLDLTNEDVFDFVTEEELLYKCRGFGKASLEYLKRV